MLHRHSCSSRLVRSQADAVLGLQHLHQPATLQMCTSKGNDHLCPLYPCRGHLVFLRQRLSSWAMSPLISLISSESWLIASGGGPAIAPWCKLQ